MSSNVSTVPSIRGLVTAAFNDGAVETKDTCAFVTGRLAHYDRNELLDVVRQMLPTFIPVMRANMRHGTVPPTMNAEPRRSQGVSRVQRFRDSWARKKDDQLYIDGIIKRFGSCTRDDLYSYAAYLDEKAEEIRQSADYYRGVGDLLADGQTVDSLEGEVM